MRYTGRDPRFSTWKWQGLKALLVNIGWVFGQSIMIAIMSYPAFLINTKSMRGLLFLDAIGVIIWIIGYACEGISDFQLYAFTHNAANRGRVMCSGLWRYSRHPNYFGEILMWWGIYLIALSVPYGWSTIIAPLIITLMLLFVTGIPWVEKALEHNPEYEQYKRKTSMLIPWFPK
jgi:steroid 5-alpha reductase family enzyme